jgi:hypothetical protein
VVGTPRSLPKGWHDNEEWQQLIDSVDAIEIPLDMLKYLKANMKNGKVFMFPIKEWLEQGANLDKIDDEIMQWYKQNEKDIAGSDFVVNLEKLQETVINQTNITLKNLK